LLNDEIPEFKELIEIKKNSTKPKELNKKEEEVFQKIVEKAFKTYETSKESSHELIGQMLDEDSYYGLRVAMHVGSKLDNNAEALLEKTIMERYFLMNGEKFLIGFMAFVYLKGKELLGYVRLTSHRLLIRGSFIKGPNIFGIGYGLTSLVTRAIENSIRSAVIKAAEKRAQAYKEPGSKRLDECEFIQLPILNARKRKRTKTYFEYYTTINYAYHY